MRRDQRDTVATRRRHRPPHRPEHRARSATDQGGAGDAPTREGQVRTRVRSPPTVSSVVCVWTRRDGREPRPRPGRRTDCTIGRCRGSFAKRLRPSVEKLHATAHQYGEDDARVVPPLPGTPRTRSRFGAPRAPPTSRLARDGGRAETWPADDASPEARPKSRNGSGAAGADPMTRAPGAPPAQSARSAPAIRRPRGATLGRRPPRT